MHGGVGMSKYNNCVWIYVSIKCVHVLLSYVCRFAYVHVHVCVCLSMCVDVYICLYLYVCIVSGCAGECVALLSLYFLL